MSLLCLSGSLRSGSYNTALLHEVVRIASAAGISAAIWTRTASVPPFDCDREHRVPSAVDELRSRIARCDGVIVATPEYNAGVPGQLKNVLDWVSRPDREHCLVGVPVTVVSASASAFGGIAARGQVEAVLTAMGARVVASGVALARAHEAFDDGGRVRDPARRQELEAAVSALLLEVRPAVSRIG